MSEAVCGERLSELASRSTELRNRKVDLAELVDGQSMTSPSEEQIAELRAHIGEAIKSGTSELQKGLLQALVHEITVTSREHIQPVLKVPLGDGL